MPERKKNRILGLVFLYLVAFSAAISGIIAYGYSEKSPQLSQNNAHEDITSYGTNDLPQKDTKLYSAPRDTLNLPIQIIVGNDALSRANTNDALREIQTVTSQNDTPTSTTSTPIATRSKGAPVTCASIDMCNKVTFNNGMSQQRKKQYLTSVFEII